MSKIPKLLRPYNAPPVEPDDEQQELQRRLARAKPVQDEDGDLQRLREAIVSEQQADTNDSLMTAQRSFDK